MVRDLLRGERLVVECHLIQPAVAEAACAVSSRPISTVTVEFAARLVALVNVFVATGAPSKYMTLTSAVASYVSA